MTIKATLPGPGKATTAIATLLAFMLVTVGVTCFRDQLTSLAFLGYPAIVLTCFLMNCGVFGLSPSGIVAVEASFVYDPIATAVLAGIGAGAGEVTSYLAGVATDSVVPYAGKKRVLKDCGNVTYAAGVFAASLVSGNLVDGVGILSGRTRRSPVVFIGAASLAKTIKFMALIYLAHTVSTAI